MNSVVKQNYSDIFITNLPAFYKINLFNRISKERKIFVIFIDDLCSNRNKDFYKGDKQFEYIFLGRYGWKKYFAFIYLLKRIKYERIFIAGWDIPLCWIAAFLSKKSKNAVVIESSVMESKVSGVSGFIKKIFNSRFSYAFVSGKLQADLALKAGFNGKTVITKGVGIFNIVKQPQYQPKDIVTKFIYVGRLSPEKNLLHLIRTFNELPHLTLSIIGFGPQENELKQIASDNIKFYGAVPNAELINYYRQNDVFVLPSTSEPWGLVVEEALNNGLPVIISSNVGCADEVVKEDYNGIIFDLNDRDGLSKAIVKITDLDYYNKLRQNISNMDFEKIAEEQVACYL